MSYKKLQHKPVPRKNASITPETRFWSNFDKPILHSCSAQVSHIDFSVVAPYDVAVTSSTRVDIYDGNSCTLKKSVTRFKGTAFGGSFRQDAKLLVAGGDEGVVRVFDLASRDILRTFRQVHTQPVRVAKFCSDNTSILSASDDKTVRRLDVPTESAVAKFEGHTDYIRCGLELPSAPSTWITGSYDHSVRTWDTRTNQNVLKLDHGKPVESLLALPHGGIILSAGGNEIKVWDLIAGKLMQTVSNHQKAITGMCLNGDGTRVLSCSLDHHVKVYDVRSYDVTHSFKYKAPVMSVGLSADSSLLAAGLLDGTVALKKRVKSKTTDGEAPKSGKKEQFQLALHEGGQVKTEKKTGSNRYFMRGEHHTPAPEDFVVALAAKKQKLKPYDRFLKKFQYHAALDSALETQRAPVIIAVIEELVNRGGLKLALAGRDQHGLEPVLSFAVKQIDNPQYSDLVADLSTLLLDMYTSVVGQSITVDELFIKLKQKIALELEFQTTCSRLTGALEMILASSSAQQSQFSSAPAPIPSQTATPQTTTSTNTAAEPDTSKRKRARLK